MALTPFTGTKPQRNVRSTFSTLFDAFITWFLDVFMAEINTVVDALNLNDVSDTSTSAITINMTASKTAIVSSGKGFLKGGFLLLADNAAPTTNYMVVQIVSYAGTLLTFDPKLIGGSGTKSDWVISFHAAVVDVGDHELTLRGGSGWASTRTMRRVFTTTIRDAGDFTWTMTAANGLEVTIPSDGLYRIIYQDESNNSSQAFGVVKNNTEYTTSINSVTVGEILDSFLTAAVNIPGHLGISERFSAGDVIAPHGAGAASPGTSDRRVHFSIVKTGN